MFGIGGPELLIIVVVALIVLGPKKLPEMMRGLGKGIAEFKRMGDDVKTTLDSEIDRADQDKRKSDAEKELARLKAQQAEAERAAAKKQAEAETAEAPAKPANEDKESA